MLFNTFNNTSQHLLQNFGMGISTTLQPGTIQWLSSSSVTKKLLEPTLVGGNPFYDPKIPALNRIGPHRSEIYSIFYGTLLGDGYGERHGQGARIHFHQSHIHCEYLYWLHQRIRQYGYVSPIQPKLSFQIGEKGQRYSSLKFRTWTFSSLVPLVNDWYEPATVLGGKRRKILPFNREEFYTPLSLALTIMDDGHFTGAGIQIATDCFTESEIHRLKEIISRKFNLDVSIHKKKTGWRLYINKASMNTVRDLVSPYICDSMLYKLNSMAFKGTK